jgi:hypothetical protein
MRALYHFDTRQCCAVVGKELQDGCKVSSLFGFDLFGKVLYSRAFLPGAFVPGPRAGASRLLHAKNTGR